MVSPWKTGFGNSTFSKPRLPTVVPRVVAQTLRPTAMPRVSRLLTRGLPNSVFWAAWKSRCSGCGFMVRQVKNTLSDSVIVRPGWCWKVWPIRSSSNSLPAIAILLRSGRRHSAGGAQLREHPVARVDPAQETLEVVAGRVVQGPARRAAAVLHPQAAESPVRPVARRPLPARVGRHPPEHEPVHTPRPHHALETRRAERAHR